MINKKGNVFVLCGETGLGKTTFAVSKWEKHIMLKCGDSRCELTTLWPIENALAETFKKQYHDSSDVINGLHEAVQNGYAIIFDSTEQIDDLLLQTIINTISSINNATLVFTFDIDKRYLFSNHIFRLLIDWDIVPTGIRIENFIAESDVLKLVITENIPDAGREIADDLLALCGGNFNWLKKLLWLVNNMQGNFKNVTTDVVTTYFRAIVEDKFRSLPAELFEVFKKSSIIGKLFHSCILESPDGFCVSGVKAYLDKLEAMNILIHRYLDEDIYEFNPDGMRDGVLMCIEPHERIEWEKILQRYYIIKIENEKSDAVKIEYLWQIKKLSISLNDRKTVFSVNRTLLYLYTKNSDDEKARSISNELVQYCKSEVDKGQLFRFLTFHNVELNIKLGYNSDALTSLNLLHNAYPNDRSLYKSYYLAKCLYNCDYTDEAIKEITELVERLKPTSGKAIENQPIYALAYSLFATVQHHFGIEDKGIHYYRLALNHAQNKVEDKAVFFDILKKCDMYFDYQHVKPKLMKSAAYFEDVGKLFKAAEVYMNLATEIIFNDRSALNEAREYLEKAVSIFESNPTELLAYARNNFAIYFILSHNDIIKAVQLLESALLVGLAPFTYMTIYLNLCMCNLKLFGRNHTRFQTAYSGFIENYNKITLHKQASQYEHVYKKLTDIILFEYECEKENVIQFANAMLTEGVPEFFVPIVNDIIRRNKGTNLTSIEYQSDINFYEGLNKNSIFLAEFRFWE